MNAKVVKPKTAQLLERTRKKDYGEKKLEHAKSSFDVKRLGTAPGAGR